jgi:glutamate synthase (NADPH/NADH) small chain
MDFLTGNTRHILDYVLGRIPSGHPRQGQGRRRHRRGDTGTDCVGTSIRQGCKSVTQLEILPATAGQPEASNPWPEWPKIYRMDYGQEEAAALQGADPRSTSS